MKNMLKAKHSLHKCVLLLMMTVTLMFAIPTRCKAAENVSGGIEGDVDGIIEDFFDAIPDGVDKTSDLTELSESVGIKRVLVDVIYAIRGQGGELIGFVLLLLAISMMGTQVSLYGGESSAFATRAVGIVASALLFDKLVSLVDGAVSSLGEISTFFSALIPVTVAVNSLGISPTTASTQAVGMGVTFGVYSYVGTEVLGTLVAVIFVLASASQIDPIFTTLSRNVKSLFMWITGILTALIGGSFALQSSISSGADTAVIRSARYAVSTSIPIVGSTVSGAMNTVAGGVAYARGIVGGGAISVILTMMLSPIVTILAYRLCLKIGMFFSSVSSGSGEGIFAPFLFALDTLLAIYTLTTVLYVVELVAFLKGGGALA